MKNILKLFFLLACIIFWVGCNETPQFYDELNEMELKSAHVEFTVEPNGTDDTDNLNTAFADAVAAGPGTVVQLVEGTYFINFIEVREFNGQFRGAGKGKTVITNIEGLDNGALASQNLNAVLLRFVGGDVCVRDITVQYNLDYPAVWLHGLLGFSSVTATYLSQDEYINVVVDNSEFKGHPSRNPCGIRAESGFLNGPDVPLSDIDIMVTNSSFSGFRNYGALVQQVKKGEIVVGTKNNGNIFDNNNIAIGLWHNVNVEMLVEGNSITNQVPGGWGLQFNSGPYPAFLQQVPQTSQSVCNIRNNVFNTPGGFGSFVIADVRREFYPEELPMLVQIKNNQVNTSDGAFTAIGCWDMYGMVICNNKFAGTAEWGVRVLQFNSDLYNENGLMLGNNFTKASYTVATILFEHNTRDWTVVGGNVGENVINNGENNIVTGMNVNTSDTPLGPTIVDNFQEMKNALEKMDE